MPNITIALCTLIAALSLVIGALFVGIFSTLPWEYMNKSLPSFSQFDSDRTTVATSVQVLQGTRFTYTRDLGKSSIISTTTTTPKWSFSYLEVFANGTSCPTKCDSHINASCGRCIEVGVMFGDFPHSERLFEVTNVFYDEAGPHFYGEDHNTVIPCGTACRPSFFAAYYWPGSERFRWYANEHQWPKLQTRRDVSCVAGNMALQPALIVNMYSNRNLYHWTFDNVFSTFVTVGHIDKVHGCNGVEVYVKDSNTWSNKGDTFSAGPLDFLWTVLFKNITQVTEMSGCYKTVYYGQFSYSSAERAWERIILADLRASSWISAFHVNLRRAQVRQSQSQASQTSWEHRALLLVFHPREPEWFRKLDWNVTGVDVQHIRFESLPYQEQIAKVAVARGLFGISGSGMSQAVYLPPRSLFGYVGLFENIDNVSLCCQAIVGPGVYQGEETAGCYVSPAYLAGFASLYWRWCQPKMHDAYWGFTSQHAQAVLKLLVSLRDGSDDSVPTAPLCLVIDPDATSPGWPRCDFKSFAPIHRSTDVCSMAIGLSYDLKNFSSVSKPVSSSPACRSCGYGSCQGDLPLLQRISAHHPAPHQVGSS